MTVEKLSTSSSVLPKGTAVRFKIMDEWYDGKVDSDLVKGAQGKLGYFVKSGPKFRPFVFQGKLRKGSS